MLIFKKLWDNHPTVKSEGDPCKTDGKSNFPDQCAIKVGVALTACGINTASIPGIRHCWYHKKSAGHVLAAEELAKGLKVYPIVGLGKVQQIKPNKFKDVIASKTGIIFFKDYWRRSGESYRNRSGDHIDLWNGSRLTDWFTWVRIQAGFSWEGSFSDYKNSKEIWFWPVA